MGWPGYSDPSNSVEQSLFHVSLASEETKEKQKKACFRGRDIHLLHQQNIVGIYPPLKTNMTLDDPPFEDAFLIENGNFAMSCY